MCTLCAAMNPADLSLSAITHVSEGATSGLWTSIFGGGGTTPAPTPRVSTLDALAGYLVKGYWVDKGGDTRSFTLDADRQITVDLSGLTDAATQYIARAALSAWSDVTGINFVDGVNAQITFDDEDAGAYSQSSTLGSSLQASFVNIEKTWDTDPLSLNSYWLQTYIHEIGHALGLGHGGNYNLSGTFASSAKFSNDSWQATVMSYFAQTENPNTGASYAFTATTMAADILAMQTLYGSNFQTRAGDTVYGNNSNVDGYLGDIFDQWLGGAPRTTAVYIDNNVTMTLFDTGGTDTLDVSGISVSQRVDLNAEAKSDVAGLKGNIIIARGTVIEIAIGGAGNDTMSGNGAQNVLTGGGGADVLDGRAGDDTLFGNDGNDTLSGGAGADLLFGGAGADRFDGGSENDTVSYEASVGGMTIDLAIAGVNTGDAAGDTYVGIETVIAGSGADIIRGASGAELLRGMTGADQIFGRAGNDTLGGGSGDDILYGGQGADALIGGEGRDRADYSDAGSGVTASLGAIAAMSLAASAPLVRTDSFFGSGSGFAAPENGRRGRAPAVVVVGTNEGAGDTFSSIEDMAGSGYNDNLTGDTSSNMIWGNNGNDTLNGAGGDDRLFGGDGADQLNGGLGNDTLSGGTGADAFNGGDGRDLVDYSGEAAGVTANLGASAPAVSRMVAASTTTSFGFVAGGWGVPPVAPPVAPPVTPPAATVDTFVSVEDLAGSNFNDRLTGNSFANAIAGNGGDDVLNGGFGNDTLNGGAGADTFVFNAGTDTVMDFVDNIDTIAIARSLFGSATPTVAQALALATLEGGNIVFHFNDFDTFILTGLTDISALQDDLVFV